MSRTKAKYTEAQALTTQPELENRKGWTDQEAKEFIREVERLKELRPWRERIYEPSTGEVLANHRDAYESTNGFARIHQENEERHNLNEKIRKERIRRIKLENKNLEWPKPNLDIQFNPVAYHRN